MPTTTTDLTEISTFLSDRKNLTDSGYYAPVQEVALTYNDDGSETFKIQIEYPDNGTDTFNLSVPKYWENDTTLATVLDNLDVAPNDVSELENRSVPIKRTNRTWEVDMTRLNSGDYLAGSSFTA